MTANPFAYPVRDVRKDELFWNVLDRPSNGYGLQLVMGSASSYGPFEQLNAPPPRTFSPSTADILVKNLVATCYSWHVLETQGHYEVPEVSRGIVKIRPANTSVVRVSFEVIERSPDEGLVRDAEDLTKRGKVNLAIDLIYSHVDRLMKQDRLVELDRILAKVTIEKTSLETLISLLTVTLPVRRRLPSRQKFYSSVERFTRETSQWDETLLVGLGN